jgi:PAS domain S-box-containing protein
MTPENKDTQSAAPGDAEAALRECDANLHAFFSSMADIVLAVARDGRLLFANAAAARLLGYAPDELGAMHLLDLHPADGRGEAGEIFAAMLNGGRTSAFLTLARKDGGLVPVETRAWLGRWNGEACLFGIARNLSAEQEAQQRFERLFLNSPALMALSTLPEQRFVDVNDVFLKTLGYARAELIGKTVAELGVFPQAEQQAALAVKLQAEGRLAGVSLQVRRKDGAVLDGLFSAEVIDIHGRPHFLTTMTDITARKRAEEALQASEALLAGLLASMPDIIFFKDPAGVYLGCNPEFARLVGRDVPGVVGSTDHDLFGAETADFFRAQDHLMMDRGVPRHNEEWIQYPDGARVLIDTLKAPLRDTGGQVIGLLGVSRDITARRQAEEALRMSEARLREVLENSQDASYKRDLRSNAYAYLSPVFTRISGYTRDELHELPMDAVLGLIHPDDLAEVQRVIAASMAGMAHDLEYRFKTKAGPYRWIQDRFTIMCGEGGNPSAMIGSVRDVTVRRQAEEALQMSEAILAKSQQISHTGSWVLDDATRELWWSDETFRIFGYAPGAVRPTMELFSQCVHPEDRAPLQEAITEAWTRHSSMGVDHRIILPDGSERVVHEQADMAYDAAGCPEKWVGVVQDITVRRQVEDALRRSAVDLHSLSVRLLAVREEERTAISRELHDSLGQHLTSFQVELMWMDRHLQTARPPDLVELYDRIVALEPLVERLTEQTQAICASLRSSVLDELGLAAAIEWQAQDTAKRTGLVCTLSLPGHVTMEKDVALALFRIMQESLTNVVRHAQATHVSLSLHAVAGAWELEVRDDGRGFAPGAISGLGAIGLLGMRERASVFGGTVDFLGGPGQGATVRVRMPLGANGAEPGARP